MPKRGDVVLVLFPHSDLRTAKPRPALIVQADDLGTDLLQVIVAMITSKTFRAKHPSRVLVKLESSEGKNSVCKTKTRRFTPSLPSIKFF